MTTWLHWAPPQTAANGTLATWERERKAGGFAPNCFKYHFILLGLRGASLRTAADANLACWSFAPNGFDCAVPRQKQPVALRFKAKEPSVHAFSEKGLRPKFRLGVISTLQAFADEWHNSKCSSVQVTKSQCLMFGVQMPRTHDAGVQGLNIIASGKKPT